MQVRTREDHLDPEHHAGVWQAPAIGVEHRRGRQHAIGRRKTPVVGLVRHQRVKDRGAMRVNHALGPAGRARRVAHRDRIVFLVRRVFESFRSSGEKRLVVDQWRRDRRTAVRHHDHLLEWRRSLELLVERQQDVIDDEKPVAGVVRDPSDLLRREAQVQRVQHAARRRYAEVALEVGKVVPAEGRDAVAFLQPGRLQRSRELPRAAMEIGKAVAHERFVGLAADDLRVGVEPARPLEDVVERQRHALHGGTNHPALPSGVTIRDRPSSFSRYIVHSAADL